MQDCKDQTRSISVTQVRGAEQLKEQIRFIHYLEKEGKLDRALEFLPTEDELAERLVAVKPLTRPELSVLVAYAKMLLKEQLVTTDITEDPWLRQLLVNYFRKNCRKNILNEWQIIRSKAKLSPLRWLMN